MSGRYTFYADNEANAFCDGIAAEMMKRFGISQDEAIGRINSLWRGVDFESEDLRYHETEEFWASDIYYGHGSMWWTHPPGLKPRPYP